MTQGYRTHCVGLVQLKTSRALQIDASARWFGLIVWPRMPAKSRWVTLPIQEAFLLANNHLGIVVKTSRVGLI